MTAEIKVKICQADVPNKNNRMYSAGVLQRAVDKLKRPELFGAIGMPSDPTVNLTEVSHTVSDLHLEDGYLVGKIRVLETPQGKILKHLLDAPVSLDFRLAGRGKVDSNGVVSEFEIDSVNAVYDGA